MADKGLYAGDTASQWHEPWCGILHAGAAP